LLATLESSQLINAFNLIDAMDTCAIWTDDSNHQAAIRICIRFSLQTRFGGTSDALIDESIRQHLPPQEQQ
jgi:hypothetical protein